MHRIGFAVCLLAVLSAPLALSAPAAAAPVTVGANVTETSGTATLGCSPACTFLDTADSTPQIMQSPCSGVVTRWRVNALIGAAFTLRIIRDNGDGSFTSTATSASGVTGGPGIAEFPTSLPISAGEFIGLDIHASGSIRGRTGPPTNGSVFRPLMVDGTAQTAEFGSLNESVLVNADVVCPHQLTVTKAGTGQGTVKSSPAGINCGPACSSAYLDGTGVILVAEPAPGSIFAGWSGGGCSGAGNCLVEMSGDQSVTATFDVPPAPGPILSKPIVTGKRAAALKRCAKGYSRALRKKRLNHALTAPVKHKLKKKLKTCRQRAKRLPV